MCGLKGETTTFTSSTFSTWLPQSTFSSKQTPGGHINLGILAHFPGMFAAISGLLTRRQPHNALTLHTASTTSLQLTRHGETPCPRWFLKPVLCERVYPCVANSRAYLAQVREARDEGNGEVYVLEAKEASDDEWEAEYQEAVAMMTVARQRRAQVNRARQFFFHVKVVRPSSTSSNRNSHVLDVGNWAIGKTIMIARPNCEGCQLEEAEIPISSKSGNLFITRENRVQPQAPWAMVKVPLGEPLMKACVSHQGPRRIAPAS